RVLSHRRGGDASAFRHVPCTCGCGGAIFADEHRAAPLHGAHAIRDGRIDDDFAASDELFFGLDRATHQHHCRILSTSADVRRSQLLRCAGAAVALANFLERPIWPKKHSVGAELYISGGSSGLRVWREEAYRQIAPAPQSCGSIENYWNGVNDYRGGGDISVRAAWNHQADVRMPLQF